MAGDAKVLKARSQKIHRWHITDEGMLGDGLADDSVSCQNVEDIQTLDGSRRQRRPTLSPLCAPIPCNLCICRPKGNDALEPIILSALGMVTTLLGQFNARLWPYLT
jgi:hypothetical protein